MQAFVTALMDEVTATTIFTTIAPLAPWIGALILVSLAIYFLRRSVKGAGKGKATV